MYTEISEEQFWCGPDGGVCEASSDDSGSDGGASELENQLKDLLESWGFNAEEVSDWAHEKAEEWEELDQRQTQEAEEMWEENVQDVQEYMQPIIENLVNDFKGEVEELENEIEAEIDENMDEFIADADAAIDEAWEDADAAIDEAWEEVDEAVADDDAAAVNMVRNTISLARSSTKKNSHTSAGQYAGYAGVSAVALAAVFFAYNKQQKRTESEDFVQV